MEKLIFISHRSSDKAFASVLESFLVKCGVSYELIFCSSLPGNDIKQGISGEIRASLKTSQIDFVILSDDYYNSAYCINEVGIIWFKDGSIKIPICLPEINEDSMLGFFDKEYKIRRLDNVTDIETICDLIRPLCTNFITSTAKLNSYIATFIEEYKQALASRIVISQVPITSKEPNPLEEKILKGEFVDDELLLFKYLFETQTNVIHSDYLLVNEWLKKNNINRQLNESSQEMLLEEKLFVWAYDDYDDVYGVKFRVDVYRQLRKLTTDCLSYIDNKIEKHLQAGQTKNEDNSIDALIQKGFTDEEILLTKYIIDLEKTHLLTGWQTPQEEQSIKVWEDMNQLDNTLQQNYGSTLMKFSIRKFIDVSAKTSYDNPKEYKIRDNVYSMILNINDASKKKIDEVMKKYVAIDDDLPF